MDSVFRLIQELLTDHFVLMKTGGILLLSIIILSLLGRFVLGKKSVFADSISTLIGILFVYILTVVAYCAGSRYSFLISPLPFVSISADELILFQFRDASYTVICAEVMSMVILAFFVSLADNWIPAGKTFFGWIFFRCLTVAVAFDVHLLINWAFTTYLPEGLITYAPALLLGVLLLMLLTGALKFLVGLFLTSVNPVIAALYTFFFANIVGRQITKAVLTTLLFAGIVYALGSMGHVIVSIAPESLYLYIPFLAILLILWKLTCKK